MDKGRNSVTLLPSQNNAPIVDIMISGRPPVSRFDIVLLSDETLSDPLSLLLPVHSPSDHRYSCGSYFRQSHNVQPGQREEAAGSL